MGYLWFSVRWLLRQLWAPLRRSMRKRLLRDGWLELRLSGRCEEFLDPRSRLQESLRRLAGRRERQAVSLTQLERLRRLLEGDRRVRGLWVTLDGLRVGWTGADRIRAVLRSLSKRGIRVVVQVQDEVSNVEALIASGADRFVLGPAAGYEAAGNASKGLFFAKTLERIGVRVEVTSAGRFKSGADALTRDRRSPDDREQVEAVIRGLDTHLVEALTEGRRLDPDRVRSGLQAAPMTAERARSHGLVDAVARDEEAPSIAQALSDADRPPKMGSAESFEALHPRPLRRPGAPPRIGVVRIQGVLVDRAPAGLPGSGSGVAVRDEVVDDLRAALHDRRIGGVVLHVDSRGGSVTASDVIYGSVRRLAADKPVAVVMADAAASGGYYVACGGHRIFAHPLTLTGSIGVFGLFPTWPRLMERLDVGQDVIRTLSGANLLDPFGGLDEAGRARLERRVEDLYALFVDVVAEQRGWSREAVDQVAQGRVWLGRDAARRGLVDQLGSLADAVAWVRDQVPGPVGAEPVWVRTRRTPPRPAPVSDPAQTVANWLGGSRFEQLQLMASGARIVAWWPGLR
jgi:protease IV